MKAVIRSLRSAFSDFRLEIEDVTVAADTVWLRISGSGANDGPFMGNEPMPDRLYALVQLGLLPPPAPRAG